MSEEELPEAKPKEMRPLDGDERKTTEKRMVSNKEEIQGLTFVKHQAQLMLDEGIDADIMMQKQKYKGQLSRAESQLKELKFAVETSEKQLREGVEVRDAIPLPKVITAELADEKDYYDVVDMLEDKGCVIKDKEVKEE